MPDLVPIRRALLSVSDKTDLIPFAKGLASRGVEIISTGGTAKALADAGIPVTPDRQGHGVSRDHGWRVKTLHPAVHGGLLGVRDNAEHTAAMQKHGIKPIDLVCISLYPFEQTIGRAGVTQSEAIEQIDIGGPSMIRSAAKNFEWVTVITSAAQYDRVVGELTDHAGQTTRKLRAELAATAFGRTSEYDAAIAAYLSRSSGVAFPHLLRLNYIKAEELRYGENPHQTAAIYRDPASTGASVVNARQLHGKQLSYNNINDAAAALDLALSLKQLDQTRTGACVIKHTNPCGAALVPGKNSTAQAIDLALAGDPTAAYGGILAINTAIDAAGAERICRDDVFLEVIIAPDFAPDALEKLRNRWVNVRLLAVGDRPASATKKIDYRSVPGGMLVQDRDTAVPTPDRWAHAAGPKAVGGAAGRGRVPRGGRALRGQQCGRDRRRGSERGWGGRRGGPGAALRCGIGAGGPRHGLPHRGGQGPRAGARGNRGWRCLLPILRRAEDPARCRGFRHHPSRRIQARPGHV
jgi:phosphoribosylaminoimidazolecarboxamide formyltransferase/IMP cyclohydrolase